MLAESWEAQSVHHGVIARLNRPGWHVNRFSDSQMLCTVQAFFGRRKIVQSCIYIGSPFRLSSSVLSMCLDFSQPYLEILGMKPKTFCPWTTRPVVNKLMWVNLIERRWKPLGSLFHWTTYGLSFSCLGVRSWFSGVWSMSVIQLPVELFNWNALSAAMRSLVP